MASRKSVQQSVQSRGAYVRRTGRAPACGGVTGRLWRGARGWCNHGRYGKVARVMRSNFRSSGRAGSGVPRFLSVVIFSALFSVLRPLALPFRFPFLIRVSPGSGVRLLSSSRRMRVVLAPAQYYFPGSFADYGPVCAKQYLKEVPTVSERCAAPPIMVATDVTNAPHRVE